MLTLNNISIILVKPQMGENIGAAARVMHNFGLTDLRLVSPRDGWPNQKAIDMSAGATAIIENAKVYNSFESAVADISILYATTARERDMNKPAVTPKQMVEELAAGSQPSTISAKTGIVFGPERTGLENFEVTYCNRILYIPVNPSYKSLNLAQAIAVISYELYQFCNDETSITHSRQNVIPASKADHTALFNFLETELDRANFFQTAEKKPKMMDNIRNIFSRLDLSEQELRTLRGILKAIKTK